MRYLRKRILIYILTFFVAVSLDWAILRFMPGDPVQTMLSRAGVIAVQAMEAMRGYFIKAFGLDLPLWQQYLNFWKAVFRGDLGISVYLFPKPVSQVLKEAIPYSVALLVPAIVLSWIAGNRFGAFAARRRLLDSSLLPMGYFLTATPYMWLGLLMAWGLGVALKMFPTGGAYSFDIMPELSLRFIASLLKHWFLPFASLFLVMFGGWAIGMRNMIIYELEADYAQYLESLGVPPKLIRRYAFRNAMLPQITGLALQLGAIAAGAIATEVVFSYPGIGLLLFQAIQNQDYFLVQGCFLFIVFGVLLGNLLVDLICLVVDPRVRRGTVAE